MPFFQTPPSLTNTFEGDRVLRSYLARILPSDVYGDVTPSLVKMGSIAARLYPRLVEERADTPRVTHWDAWGKRVDTIDNTSLWTDVASIACEEGLIATAYERKHGEHSRIHQFALAYLLEPSSCVYACPLAMTDGAARTILSSNHDALIDRAVTRLTSRDPAFAWTSGQWMTERTGGSDVAISETVARPDGDRFRLFGTKWFTSATTAQMALTLARPEGNPPGGSGLALFYVELRNESGWNGILVNRLKDKLGTRMVPTAELTLDGTLAIPVSGTSDGIKNISPMLSVTRTWNAVGAVAGMQRAIALARDYAKKRVVFGVPLAEKPLHRDTLAKLEASFQGAFFLAFRAVQLLGESEVPSKQGENTDLLRVLVPIAKLTTAKTAVEIASEVVETFGGAGYVEDTGIPRLLRDAQVLPIWEGTTNVLSLDVLRAIGRTGSLAVLEREVERCFRHVEDERLVAPMRAVNASIRHAQRWLDEARESNASEVEAGARRLSLTLGQSLGLALLVEHASWSLRVEHDGRAMAAASLLAHYGVDHIREGMNADFSNALANDSPLSLAP